MIEVLALTGLLEYALENALGIGVSTTALLLLAFAYHGRKVLHAGAWAGGIFRSVLLAVGIIALLLGVGVLKGVNFGRAGELLALLLEALAGLAG